MSWGTSSPAKPEEGNAKVRGGKKGLGGRPQTDPVALPVQPGESD